MTTLAAWILLASMEVTDNVGHHPAKPIATEGATAKPIATEGATAIGDTCAKVRAVVPGASVMCAAVYVTMAFRESGYRLDAIGDGGRSHGPFQTRATPKTWAEAVAIWTPLLQWSAQTCAEPLAALASGSCSNKAGIAISRARMAEAKRVVIAVPFVKEDENGS